MAIQSLQVTHLRNIHSASLFPHCKMNYILGCNGSGKTSLLEGIFILGTGRSFKNRIARKVINYDQKNLYIYAELENGPKIGIEKNVQGSTRVKVNQQFCQNNATLARVLPIQCMHSDSFEIINARPSIRRKLLDWGVFHVEHSYHVLWKTYQNTLKQRNILLKSRANTRVLTPWDRQLSDYANELDRYRSAYMQIFLPIFKKVYAALSDQKVNIDYYKGWGNLTKQNSLLEILQQNHERDFKLQYTQHGPHKADLMIKHDSKFIKDEFSRGQQKLILIALKLAQGMLLTEKNQTHCIYLFDDLAAEFDKDNKFKIARLLEDVKGQFFITAIEPQAISPFIEKHAGLMFHVKHGGVEQALP